MQPFDDVATLQRVIPGRWSVKATNFPMWLSGELRDPTFEYVALRDDPLVLADEVSYVDTEGKSKSVRGVDRWNGRGFTWKRNGLRGLFAKSNWEVAGVRQGLLVLRFEKSVVAPAGIDVIVGEGLDATELRSVIAADPASFGLSIEEFASLTWLDHMPFSSTSVPRNSA